MANQRHLTLLLEGVGPWNAWREENPEVSPDLYRADLAGRDLTGVNFRGAYLRHALLSGALLGQSDLSSANLSGADLSRSDLRSANLSHANLAEADLCEAYLYGSNCQEANFRFANFRSANLCYANLTAANFSNAQLIKVKAQFANFNLAQFTGALIEKWEIDGTTQLRSVECNYIYIHNGQRERCPSQGTFSQGEFCRLFQRTFEPIALTFQGYLDWSIFAAAFRSLKKNHSHAELAIQGIESTSDRTLTVHLSATLGVDAEQISQELMECYHRIRLSNSTACLKTI